MDFVRAFATLLALAAPAPDQPPPASPPAAVDDSPGKADHRNLALSFIGWSQNSAEYAYQINDERFLKGARLDAVDTLYVKKLVAKGESENVVLTEPVKQYLVRQGFARHELESEKVDQMTTRFKLGERRHLDFTLILKAELGWRLSLFDGDGSVVIQEGVLEEPFTDVTPRIYPAPDKRKMVLLIKCSTLYRTRDHLKLIRLDL